MKLSHLTLIFSLMMPVILSSCTTGREIGDPNALSDKEKTEIIVYTKYVLDHQKKMLTIDDKTEIKSKEPEVKETYTGYKTGTLAMCWSVSDKKVTMIAEGKLTAAKDQIHWILKVDKREAKWSIKNSQGDKIPEANAKDFLPLMSKP